MYIYPRMSCSNLFWLTLDPALLQLLQAVKRLDDNCPRDKIYILLFISEYLCLTTLYWLFFVYIKRREKPNICRKFLFIEFVLASFLNIFWILSFYIQLLTAFPDDESRRLKRRVQWNYTHMNLFYSPFIKFST